jgi:ABC-type multidrug transport system ATPase subunit
LTNSSIEINNLSKSFKKFKAVDNLSLQVNYGGIYGFLGPNGAGKSTTIRMMLSLIKPDAGSISFFGEKLQDSGRKAFKRIGALVEKPDFYMYLSAIRNLKYFGSLSGADTSNKNLQRILDMVSLGDRGKSKVKTYSLGMKQRLGIAQALLHNPDILIFDEPTNGLDPIGMKEVRELLLRLAYDEGKTIFLSSHILKEVESIATDMAIINKGKTIVQGKTQELLHQGDLKVTFDFVEVDKAKNYIELTSLADKILEIKESIITISMKRPDIAPIIKQFSDNDLLLNSVIPMYSLEDYFLEITQEDNNA